MSEELGERRYTVIEPWYQDREFRYIRSGFVMTLEEAKSFVEYRGKSEVICELVPVGDNEQTKNDVREPIKGGAK